MTHATREDQTTLSTDNDAYDEPREWRVGRPRPFRWNRWRPQLVLHENHRIPVTWTLRGIALVGLGLSFVYMPGYIGLAISMMIAAVEQLLERSVFLYSSIHVQPMPSFAYDPAKWTSIAYAVLGSDGAVTSHVLGFVFNDTEYASKFFALLRDWNLGDTDDLENNVRVSFVRDQDSYYLWLYPGQSRAPVKASWKALVQRAHHKRENAEPFLITLSPYYCKNFLIRGALIQFLSAVAPGDAFQMAAMKTTAAGDVEFDDAITPIWKHNYKIRTKDELTKADFEFALWKMKGRL
jgi:hypothetical protein